MALITNPKEALQKLTEIPIMKAVLGISVDDYPYLSNLLELSSGKNSEGSKVYRIYQAAADYLGQHPDLMLKKHDSTELGDIPFILENLKTLQKAEDTVMGIIVDDVTKGTKTGVDSFVGFTPVYPTAHWVKRSRKKLR